MTSAMTKIRTVAALLAAPVLTGLVLTGPAMAERSADGMVQLEAAQPQGLQALPHGTDADFDGPMTGLASMPGHGPAQSLEMAREMPVEGQIVLPGNLPVLVKELPGARVYTAADRNLGAVDSLVFGDDGLLSGLVLAPAAFPGSDSDRVSPQLTLAIERVDVYATDGHARLVAHEGAVEGPQAAPEQLLLGDAGRYAPAGNVFEDSAF